MRRTAIFISALVICILLVSVSFGAVAFISEIKGAGIEVKKSGQKEWIKASVLQSLDIGDAVRAAGSSFAVVVTASNGRAVKVVAGSPFELKQTEPRSEKAEKAQVVLDRLIDFVGGRKKDVLSMPLAVRSLKRAPGIISPKDSKTMSSLPVFEWIGTPRIPYVITVKLGEKTLWTQGNLYRSRISYPSDAPQFSPGQRYTWHLETAGYPAVSAWFEISSGKERTELEQEMKRLDEAVLSSLPITTVTMLKYDLLVSRGFSSEARVLLHSALEQNADSPLLHTLLGDYYENAGLKDLAAEEFDEAEFLISIQKKTD